MRAQQIFRYTDTRQHDTPLDCVIVFLMIFMPLLLISFFLKYYNHVIFHCVLFFTGWVGWTFSEYMAHRYLMHSAEKENLIVDFNHAYHHSHPTDIKISGVQRCLLLMGCIILLTISIWIAMEKTN
jgi:hypothetical protein